MSDRLGSLLKPGKIVKDNSEYRPDPYLDVKCPMLSAMLSMTEFEGKPRATATVLLFVEDGRSKVRINNRAQGRVGWIAVDSFEDVFEAVEQALSEDRIDWREDRSNGKYRG